MPVAVAVTSAPRGPYSLAKAIRGRHRAASEVGLPPPSPPPPREPERAQLPKAASYTYFPRVKDLDALDPPTAASTARTSDSSEPGSSPSSEEAPDAAAGVHMRQTSVPRRTATRKASRFLSFGNRSRDTSTEPLPDRGRPDVPTTTTKPTPKSHPDTTTTTTTTMPTTTASPARSMTKLRRKSWVVRAPSPTRITATPSRPDSDDKPDSRLTASTLDTAPEITNNKRPRPTNTISIPEDTELRDTRPPVLAQPVPPSHSSSSTQTNTSTSTSTTTPTPTKNKRLSSLFNATTTSAPAVPKSFSTEQLPHYAHPHTPLSPTHAHIPPLPRNTSAEKLRAGGGGARAEPRKKDELWTVFRTLDADLRKFQSKSSALKANVVRTALLPFLRQYANHPSNQKLRPEDVDRRAIILNGWWTGLLELVAGRNGQSLSGTDRPAILEGIIGIMERAEWRSWPSPFCALTARPIATTTTTTTTPPSTTSNVSTASSASSDFLADSVYHNVRNIFTQNLLSQMAFVIEKMSLRNAAASLVTFCGKTCAYVFCFCPGIADTLVRLWSPSLDMMKRVMQESGVDKRDKLDHVSDRVAASFPPVLHSLAFSSLAKTARLLRKPVAPPLAVANLDWYGLWTKRWSGAESDLFYVFVKHYHILVSDFLPVEPSNAERLCVPGMLMVHAQVLVNLDATINRHAAPPQPEEPSQANAAAAPITFDDVLEPDASVTPMSLPPANATRQMQENRLVMLIRDFLSERNTHLHTARRMFAESFARLLQAQARKITIYDSNACYTLCDFLEEAFAIMVRYEQHDGEHHSVMNWEFWLSVCKSMAASHNTGTEIKLYSFLFSVWPTLVVDEQRKASLCLDFLLEPIFFESRFNHWCPMVRSYFMRLLCWRVARFDGEETDVEVSIKRALSDRLRSVWSHYLWLQEEAERNETVLPSTQACNPAPGRRFLIIRNDNPISASIGPFLSFDGVVQNPYQPKPSPSSSLTPELEARPTSAMSTDSGDFPDEEPGKGKWGLFRSLIGGGSSKAAKAKSPAPSIKEKDLHTKANGGTGPSNDAHHHQTLPDPSAPLPPPPPPPTTHRSYSFRFSLEWVDKRFGTYQNMRLQPPRLPQPAQTLLQHRAINMEPVRSARPTGTAMTSTTYAGRALAEWTFVSHECQNFFDRRKNEGVPVNRMVETPSLNVEVFRRPG